MAQITLLAPNSNCYIRIIGANTAYSLPTYLRFSAQSVWWDIFTAG